MKIELPAKRIGIATMSHAQPTSGALKTYLTPHLWIYGRLSDLTREGGLGPDDGFDGSQVGSRPKKGPG
jgi:hypothetical protein